MSNIAVLHEAFEEEAKEIDVLSLMEEMMDSFNKESDYAPAPIDEIKVRKMMLAIQYLEKEKDRLTRLKEAVISDWDKKIKSKTEEINDLKGLIERYIKEVNGKKKLVLDVGTASLRRKAPTVKVEDIEKAKEFLKEHDILERYLKAPDLDVSLLQKSYINDFKKTVEDEAKKRIKEEMDASKNGKITKKREKEIYLKVEQDLANEYFRGLPEFLKYEKEQYSLSLRMT